MSRAPAPWSVRLDSAGPYDLASTASFLAGWPPATSTGTDAEGAPSMAYVLDDGTRSLGVTLRQAGTGALDATLTEPATPAALGQLRRILGLDLDGRDFARLAELDPCLAALQARAPGVRPILFPSPYDAAAWAVLSARTPANRAAALRRTLAEQLGTIHELGGLRIAAFPTPRQLRQLDALPGLPAEKVRRLHGVVEAAEDGRLDAAALSAVPTDRALSTLKTIRGIGDFYAQLILVRSLPGTDLMPAGEPQLLAAAARLFGEPELTSDRLDTLTGGWTPHRAWASFLLRVS